MVFFGQAGGSGVESKGHILHFGSIVRIELTRFADAWL